MKQIFKDLKSMISFEKEQITQEQYMAFKKYISQQPKPSKLERVMAQMETRVCYAIQMFTEWCAHDSMKIHNNQQYNVELIRRMTKK